MQGLVIATAIAVVLLPVAWFASEFQSKRWLRLILGSSAVLSCFGVAFVVGSLERLNYNAWYGVASKQLIDASVEGLEAGRTEEVVNALKSLQRNFEPTYETTAHFDQLAEQAAATMRRKE